MSAFEEERVREGNEDGNNDNGDSYYDDDDEYDGEEEVVDTDWVFSSVKRPVDIYLPDEDKWFAGTLMKIVDPIDRIALVSYDDEDFADEKVPFEDLRVGTLPSKKREKEKKAAEKRVAAAAAAHASNTNTNSNSNNTSASSQAAVNEIKFKRYLCDLIIGDEFVLTWQPPLEKASLSDIDQLLTLLPTLAASQPTDNTKPPADWQEFRRSLQQSRTYQDCYVLRDDVYLVSIPLHLPPIVRTPGTFISQKEQEKLASLRQTQFRLGAFLLKKDASVVLEVLSEETYMERLASAQTLGKETVSSVNLIDLPHGTMPLPAKEPHNQSNKAAVLVARVLHAIDLWNATHTGEDTLDIFCPVKRSQEEGDQQSETLSETTTTTTQSKSAVSGELRFSREEVLLNALRSECHRWSTKRFFNATCTFHTTMASSPLVLTDAHRSPRSFTDWQDLLRRQRAQSLGNESMLSTQSDLSQATPATPAAAALGVGGGKVRSDSVMSALSDKDAGGVVSKSRSGSIVTEKDRGQNKSRSGSAVDQDLTGKGKTQGTAGKTQGTTAGAVASTTTVRLNSRAARRQAEEELTEND